MSIAEQLRQYNLWKADPVNNPKPESLLDSDQLVEQMKVSQVEPERALPPVQQRSKPISVITSSDSTNGKVMEKYCWSQDLEEVVVRIPIPEHVKKGKDVHVKLQKRFIEVWLKAEADQPILKHYLWKDIDVAESHWTIVPGEAIDITLVKMEPRLWDCLTPDDDDPLNLGETEFYKNLSVSTQPPSNLDPDKMLNIS